MQQVDPRPSVLDARISQISKRSSGACNRINATCEHFDSAKGKKTLRDRVVHLQNKMDALKFDRASSKRGILPHPMPNACYVLVAW